MRLHEGENITIQKYRVKIETESIDNVDYAIRRLFDRKQFADPDGEALALGISSSFWPLFGQIWPMSRVLARVVLQEPLEGRRILEIGCGLALPSIVLKNLGGDITACDYHPLTQQFLIKNTRLNSLAPIDYRTGNWNKENLSLGRYDLVIGSDLLYETHHAKLLSLFINSHVMRHTKVIIVDPGRGSHRPFVRAMERLGFTNTWTNLSNYSESGTIQKGFVLRFALDRK